MTDQEILQKAIVKWQQSEAMPAEACVFDEVHLSDSGVHLHCSLHKNWNVVESVDDIIFEKSFIRALWGDKADFHLQRLKTNDHPLKYIEKFL